MAGHRVEIAVVVKQWRTVLDAPGADQEIDGLANCDPAPPQGTEIAGCRDGDRVAGHRHDFEAAQESLDVPSGSLAVEAL